MASNEDDDLTDTVKAKSDQLNAADLIGGPITVQIMGYKIVRSDDKQPLFLSIGLKQTDGKDKPWKPCKTMRRLMIAMWGEKHASKWVGRSVTLVHDPEVVYSGKTLGGVRVSAASHITKPFVMTLTEVRGKPKTFTIQPLKSSAADTKSEPPKQEPKPEATPANPIAARHAAICKAWKERRIKREMRVAMDDVRAFFVVATEGCVTAENALKTEVFTVEVLCKVEEFLNFEMPE